MILNEKPHWRLSSLKNWIYQFIVHTSRARENEVRNTTVLPLRCFNTLADYYFECHKVILYLSQINFLLALIFLKLCWHTCEESGFPASNECHEYFLF